MIAPFLFHDPLGDFDSVENAVRILKQVPSVAREVESAVIYVVQ